MPSNPKDCHSERSEESRRIPPCHWILRSAQDDSRRKSHLFTGWKPVLLSLFTLTLSFLLASPSPAQAQQGNFRAPPRLGYVYPAGAQQGTTVHLSIGGQNLASATALRLSGPGLTARITGYHRPLNQKEINELREQVDRLQKKRAAAQADATAPAFTDADQKAVADARKKLSARQGRQANPALAECVTVELTVAADAPPGDRELRLRTPNGLSNPIVFQVGTLAEYVSPVITAENPAAEGAGRRAEPRAAVRQPPIPVILPVLVNGQILPGEIDRYRFTARAGQHLTLIVQARALLPYLADAVPGWFQATLAVFDSAGREVAYDDDFRFNPDPVLAYVIPADGEYTVEIKDSIYRGREDFIYRLTLGELPFVTGIFPLGSTPSPKSSFTLTGWNLTSHQVEMDNTGRLPGRFDLFVRHEGHLSNRAVFVVDAQADTAELEPNDTTAQAQPVTLPALVNGRIERADETDVYLLSGRAGDQVVAEILARRLQSPLDSALRLTDAAGAVLASNDDFDDKAAGLLAHQADSRLTATLPADGDYFLHVTDAQHQGSPAHAYRLRVSPPQPDFELRVAPSTVNVRAGGSQVITVFALRHDGFNGEIKLGFSDVPAGLSLSGARLPAGSDKIQLTLNASATAQNETHALRLGGVASIAGRSVTREALPADDMMQAFLYRHLVPAREFLAEVSGRTGPVRANARLPLAIPAGGTVTFDLASLVPRRVAVTGAELADAPEGISIQKVEKHGGQLEIVLACDAAKLQPGTEGNLILRAFSERDTPAAKDGKKVATVPLGPVPAIPYIITTAKP
jgi:hypothetical protein